MTAESRVPWAIFLAAATVTSLGFLNFCATIYQCGCQSLWTTRDQHCNIHASAGRHCPFCSFGAAGYVIFWGSIVAAQAACCFLPGRWRWPARLASALAAFPLLGGVEAVVLGWTMGYWN
jgi:hypothetical protein